ncbi:MAG: HAD-IIB family hydrolase [Pseudomonadota bacterium]
MNKVLLVASDLDGSLLDHDNYSYEAAKPALQLLEQLRIPLVFVSSKTFAEIVELRAEIGNEHPFVVENGSAVYVPEGYFEQAPEECEQVGEYWRYALSPPRRRWKPVLDDLRARLPASFEDFSSAGNARVEAMTGLGRSQAEMANQREFSEPLAWYGSDEGLAVLEEAVAAAGGRVYRGGRFYTIAGPTDKGKAYLWLREKYAQNNGGISVHDLCIGDGANDVPFLEEGVAALLIPAKDRPLPTLQREDGVMVGENFGPAAWADGVGRWLKSLYSID